MLTTKTSIFIVYGAIKVTLATHMVLSRQQILSEVWNFPSDLNTRTVDIHICNIRKKLGLDGPKTVVGIGYRLQSPSEKEEVQQ